jgi:dephospho-CoA kinase
MKIPRVGITGGIGSGKSTVCRIFHGAFGVPVFYADIEAKYLIEEDPDLRRGIVEIFGPQAYTEEGRYNRPFVAGIAFSHPETLKALNALVHPAVEERSRAWHERLAANGAPYTLKEAALMIESGSHRQLDFLIVVTAPEPIRIRRVMERDRLDEAQVRARIRGQLPEADKVALANLVIINDGDQLLLPQIWAAHQRILAL